MATPHLKIFQDAPTYLAKKGEVLVKAGEASNKGFFVVKGCLRSYVVDEKGREHIYQFAPEDWLIADLEYFKRKGNAFLYIDAIEDSELKVITLKGGSMIDEVDVTDAEGVKMSLTKLHNRMYALQKRVIQLLSFTAEERYKDFLSTYPNLAQRVPLKMIASYLGVTPESLSRVRKELVKASSKKK